MKRNSYSITCTVTLQYTFEESEIRSDADSLARNAVPTDDALENLESELAEYLGINYSIDSLDIDADSLLLLGINDDPG
jgi:hypothetical protein